LCPIDCAGSAYPTSIQANNQALQYKKGQSSQGAGPFSFAGAARGVLVGPIAFWITAFVNQRPRYSPAPIRDHQSEQKGILKYPRKFETAPRSSGKQSGTNPDRKQTTYKNNRKGKLS
jgi:hypothetical protein